MPTFVTLGPEGSNHLFVLQRYLCAHGALDLSKVVLIEDFHDGARALMEGSADFMLQCAVHPDTPDVTGMYRKEIFVVDAFISPSRPMALVRAKTPAWRPRKVGVQPATRHYADLSRWEGIVPEPTVIDVGEGLLAGRYDAGIAFASLVDEHPEAFEVLEPIGAVCDAWLVFGRAPVDEGNAIVWTRSPVAARYRHAVGETQR